MTDIIWLVSTCVIIAAVIAVRAIFGKKMSAGLRYALWGLVLLRLLVPGTVFKSPVSVSSAMQRAQVTRDLETVRDVSAIARTDSGEVIGRLRRPASQAQLPGGEHITPEFPAETNSQNNAAPASQSAVTDDNTKPSANTAVILNEATPERFERMQKTLKARDILNIIWYTGMGLAALYFIAANLRFYLKLRARRERLDVEAPCPVYSAEGLSSSCLFLNSIYISKDNTEDEEKLRYVLAHELAHRRHGDGIFALLRTAALILHWYNPLVWIAAFTSRRDSELFADAAAIKSLGEEHREDYGRTLIELSSRPSIYAPIACAATMMTGGKRELKSRITHIARDRRMSFAVAAIVLAIALAAVGCTFAGGLPGEDAGSKPGPAEATEAPDTAFVLTEDYCREAVAKLAEFHAKQFVEAEPVCAVEVSDTVEREFWERKAGIAAMAERGGAAFVEASAKADIREITPVDDGMEVSYNEYTELYYQYPNHTENNMMGFGADHRVVISSVDGHIVSDVFSEEDLTGFNNLTEADIEAANKETCLVYAGGIADSICREHGITMDLENGTIKKSRVSGDYSVVFANYFEGTENASEAIYFTFDGDISDPRIKSCSFDYFDTPELDYEKLAAERERLEPRNHSRIYKIADIEDNLGAPMTPDGIAEKLGAYDLAAMFGLMGEDNYLFCTDSAAVRLETVESSDDLGRYDVTVAMRPANERAFHVGFGDVMGHPWNAIPEELSYYPVEPVTDHSFDYCYTINYVMQVKKTEDGSAFKIDYGYTWESFSEQPDDMRYALNDREQMIDIAWAVAEDVLAKYGGELSRDNCYVEGSAGKYWVSFCRADAEELSLPSVSVRLEFLDEVDGWRITKAQYHTGVPEGYDWGNYTSDNEALPSVLDFNVSAGSVSDAAWEAAKQAAEYFKNLPESNTFSCADSAPLIISVGENFSEEQPQYTVSIGFTPRNYTSFAARWVDGYSSGLYVIEDEHYLYYMVDFHVGLFGMNPDGTYHMGVTIPDDGPWG